ALADHDIAAQCDGLSLEIVYAKVAASALIFGENGHCAARLDAANVLGALRAERRFYRRPRSVCARLPEADFLAIKNNEAAAPHCSVALDHLDIAGKGRSFALVVNLKRGGLDLNRGVLVFELPRFGRSGGGSALSHARLCKSLRRRIGERRPEHRHRDNGCEPHHGSLVLAGSAAARLPGSSVMATPLKRTTLPRSTMSSRLALRKPSSIFTDTGLSETTFPLRTPITASVRPPSYPVEGVSSIFSRNVSISGLASQMADTGAISTVLLSCSSILARCWWSSTRFGLVISCPAASAENS